MAKSDTKLQHINTERAKKPLRKAQWAKGKSIVAFDTETNDGDIFIISTSSKDKEFVYENDGDILTSEEIFDIITQKYFRNTLNVWFNLGFDAEVILKVLPEDKLKVLQVTNQVEWQDYYRITYLPNKFLRIESGISPKDEKGKSFDNSVEYFDVAQLFQNNLKGAVKEWLPDNDIQKNGQNIDVKRFNEIEYIQDNYEKILEYAKDDVILTRQITEKLIKTAEDIDIPCGKPFSTGYLAESYLKNRLPHKIGWGPDTMQAMAWDSYAGGRFEVFKRGNVGEVVGPDINSAYPAIMKDLPDPSTLQWQYFHPTETMPTLADIRNADFGFLEAYITTDKSKTIQPFSLKIDDIVKYPALDNYKTTALIDTFLFALDNGYIKDFQLLKAYLGEEDSNTKYPFGFFPDLYKQRKVWENKEKYRRAWLLKIILNSMYGKTAQTQYKVELAPDNLNIDDIPEGVKVGAGPSNEVPHLKYQECGSLFNPFISTYITGLTRLELHKAVEKYGLVDDTVLFATDSIMVDKEAYYSSDFSDLLSNDSISYQDQLGMWDFDYEGKGFVIGSGVYEVELPDGTIKMATRGFRESKLGSFKEAAQKANGNGITIQHNRPYTLGEAMHQKKLDNTDIGKFFKGQRELKPDFDRKREWQNTSVTWDNLLKQKEGSKPIVVSE